MKKIVFTFLVVLVAFGSTITNASEDVLLPSEMEDVLLPSEVEGIDLLKTWVGEESNNETVATGSIDISEKTTITTSLKNRPLPKYLPKTWAE